MPKQKVSRQEVITKLFNVFRTVGYDGASLTVLSKETGLQRASLYHLFPGGKNEMAETVIEHVDATINAALIEPLYGNEPPEDRMEQAVVTIAAFYEDGSASCLLESMSVGVRDDFALRINRSMQSLIRAFKHLAVDSGHSPAEAENRATDALARIQGALVVARGTGNNEVFTRTLSELSTFLIKK